MGSSKASSSSSIAAKGDEKKTRAKHACRECNSRRVRCDVTAKQPCSNCTTAGVKCEILPSRRGRYPRRSRRLLQSSSQSINGGNIPLTTINVASVDTPSRHPVSNDEGPDGSPQHRHQSRHDDTAASSPAPASGTLFFGESNFLTIVPGNDTLVHQTSVPGSRQRPRLTFPIPRTPQSTSQASSESASFATPSMMRYLRDEGALDLPELQSCLPVIEAYFAWFHPSYPVLDRDQVARRLMASSSSSSWPADTDMSPMLLQAMLFIGATYCDEATIRAMGFKDRSQAKTAFYTRARLLFHADWEKDEIVLIQALFLMSFWRGAPTDVRDVRYWLGVVITLAESYGLHRSCRSMSKTSHTARMRRRIWWSIYVRERQAAASLGLPSRIRDEDCDIEPLSQSDLEFEMNCRDAPFGWCQSEHVTYAIKMVEIAKLLGRIIDLHFVPHRSSSDPHAPQELTTCLEAWRNSLPETMKSAPEEGTDSVWTCLLDLAYNHVKILIHRNSFLGHDSKTQSSQVVLQAARRISRIAEDMSTQGTLRYGQMHLITSIFSALCIHTISIRRDSGVARRLAEHRAETCLLCLKEVQKYWRINNNVLDLFLQYLDRSIAARLHGTQPDVPPASETIYKGTSSMKQDSAEMATCPTTHSSSPCHVDSSSHDVPIPALGPGHYLAQEEFQEQYFNLVSGSWAGDDALSDLGLFLEADDVSQTGSGFNILGRSL